MVTYIDLLVTCITSYERLKEYNDDCYQELQCPVIQT